MEGMKEFPDNYFDLCIVDPPYGMGIDEESENKELGTHFHGRGRSKKYQEVYAGDAETPKNLGGGGTGSAAGSTGTRRTHFTFGYRKSDKNYEQKRKQAEELRKKS